MTLRVLVIDDHAMFAEALAARLAADDGLDVVGVAGDSARALLLVRSLQPDVVTLDANLGDDDGVELARELCAGDQAPRAVMVTCVNEVDRILQGIWAGVVAWVPKETPGSILIDVVKGVARGHGWLPPELTGEILRTIVGASAGEPPDATRLSGLTPRERQVLRCMVAGLDRSATAAHLGLSLNTVRTHAQSVLTKLHVHSALEAVSVALAAGMRPNGVSGDEPRLGVIRRTEPPRVVYPANESTSTSKGTVRREAAAIGVGVLVRWPDRRGRNHS